MAVQTVEHGSMRVDSTSTGDVAETLQLLDDASTEMPAEEAPAVADEAAGDAGSEDAPSSNVSPAASEAPTDVSEPQLRNDDGTFRSKAKKGSLKWRIDHATWEREEARRERDAVKAEKERLAAEIAQLRQPKADPPAQAQTQAPEPAPVPSDKPQLEQFESYEEYVEAVADWKAEQKLNARDEQAKQRAESDARLAKYAAYQQRQAAFAKTVADYHEKVDNAPIAVPPVMAEAILTSEHGPAIAYFLASHPEEAEQLAREADDMPATAAPLMRRLLEAKVSASAAPSGPARAASRSFVPPPIKPVSAGPIVTETPPDDLPFGPEYVEKMNQRDIARFKRQHGMK